jgi:transforming growth factor-beta-induced protein
MKLFNNQSILLNNYVVKAFLLVFVLFISACEDDDDTMTMNTIVDVAQENPELSTLVDALVAAGLTDFLSGPGPYTVFAPTNAAFQAMDPATLNTVISTPSLLTALLQYHVSNGKVMSTDLSNGSVPTLLAGQNIEVNVDDGVVLNGSSNVTEADVDADNGVIHIIDEVLLPDDFVAETIVQIAAGNPDFSTLVAILSLPELSDLLAAANNPTSDLTVFAPTNDAFAALFATLGKSEISEVPVEILNEIVQYHILGGAVFSDELSNGEAETLLEGESVTIDISNGVKVDDSNVVIADVAAINGVIHAVDAVLLPSYAASAVGTISEIVLFDNEFTILANALRKAELLETVSTTDDLTLFAPDNAGFIAAGITSLEGLEKEDLTPVLLYHVLNAKVLSTELPESGIAKTLSNEQNIYLGYLTDRVLINGLSRITAVDMVKSNGVVHKINRTLVPPAHDVVDIAVALADNGDDSEFTVLVSLLSSDSLSSVAEALKNAENVTIFAPTDQAFQDIIEVVPTLNEAQLTQILQYHAATARVFSSDLQDGQVLPMISGETLKVNIVGEAVSLTDKSGGEDAKVDEVNIHGSNGVIHVVDKVLIPTL